MIVRFVEIGSGTELWREWRPSVYSSSIEVDYNTVVQPNSKRRTLWWIKRIEERAGPYDADTAYVMPANKRAQRRTTKRKARR